MIGKCSSGQIGLSDSCADHGIIAHDGCFDIGQCLVYGSEVIKQRLPLAIECFPLPKINVRGPDPQGASIVRFFEWLVSPSAHPTIGQRQERMFWWHASVTQRGQKQAFSSPFLPSIAYLSH
jgi:hypothetical protein